MEMTETLAYLMEVHYWALLETLNRTHKIGLSDLLVAPE